ncbi:peptidylprolyl isomerase [Alicyclobacillus dauci]|uniref:Peptidyl-prolyl cis-trans isomerase n=1 Tax=Alicyclobacillus dauci TaxID=1475485 RepID=A0ABY6Z1K1_9BACL|nr:peptidylprolyl isomerase [Alicyclobacillus dauci]WAH35855.1 peptidylprolyl isomerase [Alicyclobacillus dauci]
MQFRKPAVGAAIAVMAIALTAGCGAPSQNQTTDQSNGNQTAGSANQSETGNQGQSGAANTSDSSNAPKLTTTTQRWSSPPKMTINPNKNYDAVVHTNYGDFTIQLMAKDSPKTVNNFVFLAQHGFYHDDKFFRIMQSFMIQTGDPNNNGTGGPGYQFADELPPKTKYAPGIVAMANAGPNTNGSQFFIGTGSDVDSLNSQPNYTIFGKVSSGMDVVNKIAAIPVTTNPQTQEPSYPTKTAYIESVDIQVH